MLIPGGFARAGVHAYRTSDGSEDRAFVTLGPKTRPYAVVPDGTGGAYLVGHIAVSGGQRQVVRVLASGRVDDGFRPVIRGGRVWAAAVHGRALALAGTFTSVGGVARRGLAVVDARSGRPLGWEPAASWRSASRVAFAGSTLVAAQGRELRGWAWNGDRPAWRRRLSEGQGAPGAPLVAWRGAVWAAPSMRSGEVLARIDARTGRMRVIRRSFDKVTELHVVGDGLVAFALGRFLLVDARGRIREGGCGEPADGAVTNAVAGDWHTLYVGNGAITNEPGPAVPAVTACPSTTAPTTFHSPLYPTTAPSVTQLALVGSHVLVFTVPWH
jgi:hypothetical protein